MIGSCKNLNELKVEETKRKHLRLLACSFFEPRDLGEP